MADEDVCMIIPEPITCKAMVAFGVNDLREEEVIVAPPKAGEVRVKVRPRASHWYVRSPSPNRHPRRGRSSATRCATPTCTR